MAGLAGIEPTTFVSKTKMISVSPKTDGTPCLIRTDIQLLLRESALPISVKGHCLAPLGGIEPPL